METGPSSTLKETRLIPTWAIAWGREKARLVLRILSSMHSRPLTMRSWNPLTITNPSCRMPSWIPARTFQQRATSMFGLQIWMSPMHNSSWMVWGTDPVQRLWSPDEYASLTYIKNLNLLILYLPYLTFTKQFEIKYNLKFEMKFFSKIKPITFLLEMCQQVR